MLPPAVIAAAKTLTIAMRGIQIMNCNARTGHGGGESLDRADIDEEGILMNKLDQFKLELAEIKSNPPNMHESPADTGQKLIALFDALLRLSDELLADKRSG